MRKLKLLFAAFAAMVSLGASAQLTSGTVYWIQDASTGEFISQGANWGTQATVQDVGGLGFEVISVSDGVFKLKNIMWNKVNNADLGLRVTDGYCDQPASDVTLTASGDGFFVGIAGGNYLCNNQTENSYGVKPLGLSTSSSDATVWKFLTKTEYDAAIQAYKDKQAASFATSLGYTGVASVSALEAILNENYITKDYTSSITNAALNAGNTNGWTAIRPNQRDQAFGSENGTCAEAWNGCVVASQTVSGLPNGLFKVTFVGTFRPKGKTESERLTSGQTSSPAYVFANDAKEEFIHWIDVSAKADNRTGIKNNAAAYTSSFYTYVTDGSLNLGVKQDTWYAGNMWCPFGYFTLTYYSNEVSDEDVTAILERVDAVDGKIMEGSVQEALTTAKTNFNGSTTIANLNALSNAITAAETSVDAYAKAKEYLDEAETILAGTNVYTAAAYATYYTTPKAKYEARTLTTAEANALVKTTTGWHVENTIDDILLSAWTIGGDQCTNYSKPLYINTWSVEGVTDGSEFLAPFFEYWTDDKQSLAATTMVATVSGLTPNATYSFTIRARVRQTDNQTKIANGITMQVNGGDAVDISSGTIFKTGPFYIGNFSAVGKTDAYGNLTCTITVAANSNISWLSFYNCKYTEGEDLSAYIADYEFALNTATNVNGDAAYAAVTGKEKTDLTAALTTYAAGEVDETDKAALIAAKEALETASNAFVAAAAAYTAFVELNATVAATLGLTLPTISETTVAADLDVEGIIVDEYTAAKAYTEDYTDKLGDWTNAPGNNQSQSWDDTAGDKYLDLYNSAARAMTQTVTLPAGDYALIAKGRASVNGLLTLTVGSETVTFPHKGASGFGIATDGTATFATGATYANNGNGWGWEYRVMTFTSDGETPITLTFDWTTANQNWCGLDDIELRCNPVVLDYTALQTAYDAVAVPTLGFEEGEYAPYNNVENLTAISSAKSLLENQDATNQTEIDDAAAALTNMTWTENTEELNAIYDGTFATAVNNGAPLGWTMSNNSLGGDYHSRAFVGDERLAEFNDTYSGFFMRFDGTNSNRGSMYYYGNTEGYTMPLAEGATYRLTVDFSGWGSTGKPLRLNITGPEGFESISQQFNTENRADTEEMTPQKFDIVFVATVAGDYVINFQTPGSDSNTHNVVISNASLMKAQPVSITMTDAGYATYCSDVALDFVDSELIPYVGKMEGDEVVFEPVESGKVPAGVGILLGGLGEDGKATAGTYEVRVSAVSDAVESILIGVTEETVVKDPIYVLRKEGDKVGFFKTKSAFTVRANSAYLPGDVLPTDGARQFISIFGDGSTTGIAEIETMNGVEKIYNLNGQRVSKPTKGMYIVNGQKMLKK